MKSIEWDALNQNILSGDCILMLGPEIPIDTGNDIPSQSMMDMLKKKLCEELANEININNDNTNHTYEKLICNNINELATKYYREIGKSEFQASIVSFLNNFKDVNSKIYENLASLPFRFVVNTTPDEIYIKNLKVMGKDFSKDYYHYRGELKDLAGDIASHNIENKFELGTPQKPFIYYLYGSIDDPTSLIISENDLLDFLVNVISNNPSLPKNISSQFKNEHKCFLFLGFNFLSRNWFFRILLHVIHGSRKDKRSFALEDVISLKDEKLHAAIFFTEQFKIKFIPMDIGTFVTELKTKFEEYKNQRQDKKDTQSYYQKPRVFISHTDEDSDYAAKMFTYFKEQGLEPWYDKENLRSGDDWDKIIKDVIKDADAFILLQSKTLTEKIVGYINKEIEIALDRASYYRKGKVNFFFPVIIDKETKPLFSQYQSINLTEEGNLEKLVKDIKRSHQRKQRYQTI